MYAKKFLSKNQMLLWALLVVLGNYSTASAYLTDPTSDRWMGASRSLESLSQPFLFQAAWNWPIKKAAPITSCFGSRLLLKRFNDFHEGVDFAVPKNTRVYPVASGRVLWTGNSGCAGRTVVIEHQLKNEVIYSSYKHLGVVKVSAGQQVKPGQSIALSGASGRPLKSNQKTRGCISGPHLHLELQTKNHQYTALEVRKILKKTRGRVADTMSPVNPVFYVRNLAGTCRL